VAVRIQVMVYLSEMSDGHAATFIPCPVVPGYWNELLSTEVRAMRVSLANLTAPSFALLHSTLRSSQVHSLTM
jgi:hypothetical protein